MKLFIAFFLGMLIFDVVGRVIWLVKGEFPQRTAVTTGIDLVLNGVLLLWAVVLVFA